MALSDQEIKRLAEKVNCFLDLPHTIDDLPILQETLNHLDKIIKASPSAYYFKQRADTKYQLCYMSSGHLPLANDALRDIDRAIELDPDQALHYRMRAYMRFDLMRYLTSDPEQCKEHMTKARSDLMKALSLDPTLSQIWLDTIAYNILADEWDEAISVYGQSEPYIKSPSDKALRAWMGCLALTLAGDVVAEEDKQPLIEAGTSTDRTFIERIAGHVVPLRDNLSEKQIHEVDLLNELLADRLEDPMRRGFVYGELRLHDKAVSTYNEILKKNPMSSSTWSNKGFMLQELGDYQEALRAYSKAIEITPDYFQALLNKSKLLMDLQRHEEALSVLDKTISLRPDDAWLWIDKSSCLSKLSRHNEALKASEEALALDPGNNAALAGYARALRDCRVFPLDANFAPEHGLPTELRPNRISRLSAIFTDTWNRLKKILESEQ
ncbi:MAG: tetratricopeptide repeat protein [Candidatus Aquicultorales bacterium]